MTLKFFHPAPKYEAVRISIIRSTVFPPSPLNELDDVVSTSSGKVTLTFSFMSIIPTPLPLLLSIHFFWWRNIHIEKCTNPIRTALHIATEPPQQSRNQTIRINTSTPGLTCAPSPVTAPSLLPEVANLALKDTGQVFLLLFEGYENAVIQDGLLSAWSPLLMIRL